MPTNDLSDIIITPEQPEVKDGRGDVRPMVERTAQLPHRPGGTDAGRPGNLPKMRSPREAGDVR